MISMIFLTMLEAPDSLRKNISGLFMLQQWCWNEHSIPLGSLQSKGTSVGAGAALMANFEVWSASADWGDGLSLCFSGHPATEEWRS